METKHSKRKKQESSLKREENLLFSVDLVNYNL